MLGLLWLVPALPMAGFLALVAGPRSTRKAVAFISAGSVGASMAVAILVALGFIICRRPVMPIRRSSGSGWRWWLRAAYFPLP